MILLSNGLLVVLVQHFNYQMCNCKVIYMIVLEMTETADCKKLVAAVLVISHLCPQQVTALIKTAFGGVFHCAVQTDFIVIQKTKDLVYLTLI